jgi:hypothetical protein
LNPILSSRFFSGPHFGVILGTLATFYHGAAAIAVWLAGHAHDLTGSYRLPLLASLLSVCLATGCVWLAAPRRVKPVGRREGELGETTVVRRTERDDDGRAAEESGAEARVGPRSRAGERKGL